MNSYDLNQQQLEAVNHDKGPMIVIAGPGSGKTTVITERVNHLVSVRHVPQNHILVVTFTRAAAKEMRERFRLSYGRENRVWFGTFHSIFFRILRWELGYGLERFIKEEEKWEILYGLLKEAQWDIADEEEAIKEFLLEMSLMKSDMIRPEQYEPKEMDKKQFQWLYRQYDGYKTRQEKMDFDDILTECYALLKNDGAVLEKYRRLFQYILVDEFQDINQIQYACVKLLAEPENNLFVVGDDDQSIYHFRGARPEIMLRFLKDYPNGKKVTLSVNYRSTEKIIKLSRKIIEKNKNRYPKDMKGVGVEGDLITFFSAENESQEAKRIADKILTLYKKGVPWEEMAVIFRTNLQAGLYARTFLPLGIPFYFRDGFVDAYSHWIGKDIAAYLRLSQNRNDKDAFFRIANRPKRYLKKALLEELYQKGDSLLDQLFLCGELQPWQLKPLRILLEDLGQLKGKSPYQAVKYIRFVIEYDDYIREYAAHRRLNGQALLEVAEEITALAKDYQTIPDFLISMEKMNDTLLAKQKGKQENIEGVVLSTLHGIKGLEFEAVFIPSIVEGILPHDKSKDQKNIEEERRLFYVGATRAKRYLSLSEMKNRYEKETKRSRFLKELGLGERKREQKKK